MENDSSRHSKFEKRYARFKKQIESKEYCQEYVYKRRWRDGFRCPECDHDEHYKPYPHGKSGTILYQCKSCDHQTSITSNTDFKKSRTSLPTLLHIIFLVTRRSRHFSTMDIMGKVKLTNYKTVLLIRKKIEKRLAKLDKKKIATKIVWSRWEFLISYLFKTIKEKSRKSKAEEGNDALIKKLKRRMRKH